MLEELFARWAGEPCMSRFAVGANGSNRKYFRLNGDTKRCIAALNDDVRENAAFIYYSNFFHSHGLPVPEIYAVGQDNKTYLQSDLGDTTLYDVLIDRRNKGLGFDDEMKSLYKQVLSDLVDFQIVGRGADFSKSYPREAFDRQSLQWDFNYFKYYFLKLAYIPFDEQLLEEDFDKLINYLLDDDCSYFLYRDFQPRNIMLNQNKLFYIDFQGGRRGAAQYDVASILYSARSELSESIREELIQYYTDVFFEKSGYSPNRRSDFIQRYYGYVLARIMQAMGAYGYRGYFEHKDHFLKSLPLAINNLKILLDQHALPINVPHLTQVLQHIVNNTEFLLSWGIPQSNSDKLTVSVSSFSYKKGLPSDSSGNGGGFIFDCRALPNPGRYAEYKAYTGKDTPVIEFLSKESVVDQFLQNAQHIIDISVSNYIDRGFTSLSVSFGCTGGQHRSVYCAEKMADYIRNKYPCNVVLNHREQD